MRIEINVISFITLIFGVIFSNIILAQPKQIDSFIIVSYDASFRYMQDFDGTPNVAFLKTFLDDKAYWKSRSVFFDEDDIDIKYRCVVTNRKLTNRFEQLLSNCATSSYMDLSNFFRISTRIGLKVYRGNQVEYMFIQPKSSDYYKKFIITNTIELQASSALIRFLQKMKRQKHCDRC